MENMPWKNISLALTYATDGLPVRYSGRSQDSREDQVHQMGENKKQQQQFLIDKNGVEVWLVLGCEMNQVSSEMFYVSS